MKLVSHILTVLIVGKEVLIGCWCEVFFNWEFYEACCCQFFLGLWWVRQVNFCFKILNFPAVHHPKPCRELIKSLNSIVKTTNKEKFQASCFLQYIILNAMKEDQFFRQEKPFLTILKLSDFFFFLFNFFFLNLHLNESEHFSFYKIHILCVAFYWN